MTSREWSSYREFVQTQRRSGKGAKSAEDEGAKPLEAFVGLEGKLPSSTLENLVLTEVLAAQALAEGLHLRPGNAAQLRYLGQSFAIEALDRVLAQESRPSAAEIGAYYRAHQEDFLRPRRWRLLQIFKAWPPEPGRSPREIEDARGQLRAEMTALRRRAQEGESFSELAQQHSDSTSAIYGGRIGIVTLDRLHPEVASVVAGLEPGDLSPPIETEDGLILLRCNQVFEARQKSLAEAEGTIRRYLTKKRKLASLMEIDRSARASLEPTFHPLPKIPEGEGEEPAAAVVTYRVGEELHGISRADLEVLLSKRVGAPTLAELALAGPEELRPYQDQLLERWGRDREARRRDLVEDPEGDSRSAWARRRMLASFALRHEVDQRLPDTDPQEIEARVADELAGEPARLHKRRYLLRWIEAPVTPNQDKDFYRRLDEATAKARSGEITFAEIPAVAGAGATIRPAAWFTDRSVGSLGRPVLDAVQALQPGGITPLLPEDRRLLIFRLVERQEQRPWSREEQATRIRERLRKERQAEVRQQLEREILKTLAISPVAA